MRAYGIPRVLDTEYPDVADIRKFGFNTSTGGRDYFKNKASKAASRRYYKKRHRLQIKAELRIGTHAGKCTAL